MSLKASIETVAPLHEGMVSVVPLFICAQSVQLLLLIFPGLVLKSSFTSIVSPFTIACVTQMPVTFWYCTVGAPFLRWKSHFNVTGASRSANATLFCVNTGVSVRSLSGATLVFKAYVFVPSVHPVNV